MSSLLPIALACAFSAFYLRRQLVYLHLFQQDEYDAKRFLPMLVNKRLVDRKASVIILVAASLPLVPQLPAELPWLAAILGLLAVAFTENDPRKSGKKKLAMTARATRIYWVAAACFVPLAALTSQLNGILFWLLVAQLIPLFLVLGNALLSPWENHVQKKFWLEAHAKLKQLDPLVVAVTGSYGKSSVKHILGHILSVVDHTLVTPGSINTPMGISRIIREKLKPHHKYFVVEMGAYGPGSIARLCDLAPPDHGIITAIGAAHYERFKSLETVAQTKFELADAVLTAGGKVIVATSCLNTQMATAFCATHEDAVILAGDVEAAGCRFVNATQSLDGLEITLEWAGQSHTIHAPLFGTHQTSNICLAFAAACTLGVAPETVILALKNVPQLTHRLEVKRQANGITYIDDAYNSNPEGFASALGLLSAICPPGGRRILITPGMVELGDLHDEAHAKLGSLAAQHVDILVPVLPERIESFIAAFASGAPDREVVPCATFAEASEWMAANLRDGDLVLLENDLPDLYESAIRL